MYQYTVRVLTQAHQASRLLFVVCCAELLLVLDSTVVNLALVPLGRDLHLSASTLAWVVNGYGLTFAGLLMTGGRVADLLGRRRALIAGVAVFGLACAAAGLAQGPVVLLSARLVHGCAAALVTPPPPWPRARAFPSRPPAARSHPAWSPSSPLARPPRARARDPIGDFDVI